MYYPNGTVVQQVTPSLVSGSATDGTFRASFTVPSGVSAGNYEIKAQATDLAGKYTHLQILGTVTISAPTPTPTPTPEQGWRLDIDNLKYIKVDTTNDIAPIK